MQRFFLLKITLWGREKSYPFLPPLRSPPPPPDYDPKPNVSIFVTESGQMISPSHDLED